MYFLVFRILTYIFAFCRRIGKDLSNTFAKLEKLTICKFFFIVMLAYFLTL